MPAVSYARWFGLGIVLIIIALPIAAEAQVCVRGKPCGNTCIARDRTCRVGPGTARSGGGAPAPAAPAPTSTPAPAAPAPAAPAATPAPSPSASGLPEGTAFVASSRGRVYYWVGCSAWRSLAAANLRFFASREAAVAAGYLPSSSRGCSGPPDSGQAVSAAALAPAGSFAGPTAIPCVVANVVDGDTLDCSDGRRIRLLLIDAPEIGQGSFGALAKQVLEGLAPLGATLAVEVDVVLADRYGRTLAHLLDGSGRSVNRQLLEMGVAVVSIYPPNVRHVDEYRVAAAEAQSSRRGLWALDAFSCSPSDFRAGTCRQ